MSFCIIYSSLFFFSSVSLFLVSIYYMIFDYSVILELELVNLNSSPIEMVILLDWMSTLFMSFVLFISSMVVYYSDDYMHGDFYINRFIVLVSLFVLSMMLLIISPNLISILLGWDGLGLVSYCLVIYYQNVKSFNSGMLTALSNRVGDVALLLAIAWMLNYGSWNFLFYFECAKNDMIMVIISVLVVVAAMTKSAQIPFSAWLPAAMAAPTPVSSLVHSSTLVTAGVYLLIRFSVVFNSGIMLVLLFISSLTMFMAGLGANFEFDLKKIIALSTLSQLGLMLSILALGGSQLAFFHLLTHALFKALLFMCAGAMIHNLSNCQDVRFMGGIVNHMPLTACMFFISNMALCGLPFLSGFYSKDLILEVLSMDYLNFYVFIIFFVSTGLTVSYTARLIYYSMMGDFNFFSYHHINDNGFIMLKGMMGLIFLVVLGGSFLSWLMFPKPYYICLPFYMKMMTIFVIFIGFWMGFEFSKFSVNYTSKSLRFLELSNFCGSMWNLPILSTLGAIYGPLFLGHYFFKIVDQGWSECAGAANLYFNFKSLSSFSTILGSNNLKVFLSMIVFWVVILLVLF
uniref:NADH-ubiquinone oxidoreductase chain 5 n=1 Tax=Acmaeodera sp. NCS-2009 TaxID=590154 RepID=D1G5M9_9COLE|nr:NADH dehydrogenase subunit 5 [Acmaeodera sp. NCS-2009]ACM45044.1 NADH dehydrogenase subunit 5 [Acmaeodera sp. NCS-2009]